MGTTGRGRTWKRWTEEDARRALDDWNRADESLTDLADRLGLGRARLARWALRLGYAQERVAAAGGSGARARSRHAQRSDGGSGDANNRPGFVALTFGGGVGAAEGGDGERVAILVHGIRVELGAGASVERIVEIATRLARTAAC